MKQLHQHVIPNVAAHWRKVAEFLEFKISAIDLIEEKCRNDPLKCCEETFREWLKADCGIGPKTWSTLMANLKGITRLKSVAEELCHELNINSKSRQFIVQALLGIVVTIPKFRLHMNRLPNINKP